MENNNYLGIYISEKFAHVSVITHTGTGYVLVDSFRIDKQSDQEQASFASQIRAELDKRKIEFQDAAVALDCSMFVQHNLFTQFVDVRQIAQTIRFDAEDVMAGDVSQYAITFALTQREEHGSRVTVFAARQAELKELVLDLQANGIDPVTIEPDGICLARSLKNDLDIDKDANPLFASFTDSACYISIESKSTHQPLVRTFLYDTSQDKTTILSREIVITKNLPAIDADVNLAIVDDTVETSKLAELTGMEVKKCSEVLVNDKGAFSSDPAELIANAIAAGAAMINFVRTPKIDFRADFMPYQGKKKIIESSLRILSIACTIVLVAFAMFWTLRIIRVNSDIKSYNEKIKTEYKYAMKRNMSSYPVKDAKSEINKLKNIKSGISSGDETSVPSRLMQVLEAVNSASPNLGLKIDSVSVTEKTIRIDGNTSGRSKTQAMLAELRKHKKLKVSQETLKQVGPEDRFIITIETLR